MKIFPLSFTAVSLCICLFIGGCGERNGSFDQRKGEKTSLTVAAAASLKDVFDEIGREFEKKNPDISVRFNYAASNLIARQVEQGAPFDIIALAAEEPMNELDSAGLLQSGSRIIFARNRLCVVVDDTSKLLPTLLTDLADPSYVRIAMASPGVPIRLYAEDALRNTGLWEKLESRFVYGANVRQVLDYVETGEADCGFVYISDALISGMTLAITIDSSLHRPILYPAAILRSSALGSAASNFISYLSGPTGRGLLRKHGFDTE